MQESCIKKASIKVMNLIDNVRRISQDNLPSLDLPQIVVAGDQSSGKSTIMEALSNVPLPKGKGMILAFSLTAFFCRNCYKMSTCDGTENWQC